MSTSLNYLQSGAIGRLCSREIQDKNCKGFSRSCLKYTDKALLGNLFYVFLNSRGQSWDVLSSPSSTKAKVISSLLSRMFYSPANLYIRKCEMCTAGFALCITFFTVFCSYWHCMTVNNTFSLLCLWFFGVFLSERKIFYIAATLELSRILWRFFFFFFMRNI